MNFGTVDESSTVLYCAIMGSVTLFMLVLGSAFSVTIEDDDEDYIYPS